MAQTQIMSSPYALRAGVESRRVGTSHKAEAYPSALLRASRWGVEIECFLPERAINELGISIRSSPRPVFGCVSPRNMVSCE
jgi:hypothetical protein